MPEKRPLGSDLAKLDATADEIAEDTGIYFMANLPPRLTGLPMVVWVQERDPAVEMPTIKVSLSLGSKINPDKTATATVTVHPHIRIIPGILAADDRQAVSDWVRLNELVILDYWHRRISAVELFDRLRRLP
jgi:hypothetical protein